MNKYYIPFDLSKNVNYNYIFSLYSIAEFDTNTKRYNIIKYKSKKQLAEMLDIAPKTLSNIINNKDYNLFFYFDDKNKQIQINNNFTKDFTKKPFVILYDEELKILLKEKDNLLLKYFIYLKYFCGYTESKGIIQDFTIKQFLEFCGYSINSNNYISRISSYNSFLCEKKLIKIKKKTDELGHTRNIYTF
jgi:hypothetical protein